MIQSRASGNWRERGEDMAAKNNNVNNDLTFGGMHPLESELRRRLRPITPNPEYINRLKSQLNRVPRIMVENRPKLTGWLMILMGLFSSVVAVWIIRKISKQ
jgi:hypothetical protein